MSPNAHGKCWHCGHALERDLYHREAECPGCRKQTHVCMNCRFYDTTRANACLEPIAEAVNEKRRANFCDYFEPHSDAYKGAGTGQEADALRAAADRLFDL
jgi:hypothetical protein